MSNAADATPTPEPTGNLARLARVYSEALYAAAQKQGQAEALGQELNVVASELVGRSASIATFLQSAAITRNAKLPVLKAAFENRVSPLFFQFLGVLNQNNRLAILPEVAQAYQRILDQLAGRVAVKVTSARELTPAQLEQVQKTLAESLGKTPMIHLAVDPELLGGMIVQIGDRVYDTTIRTRLETLRNHLLSSGTYVLQA
jgi:F-type H+-transporting ATPase subunit delta